MLFEGEEKIDELTHEFTDAVDKALDKKEAEILEV